MRTPAVRAARPYATWAEKQGLDKRDAGIDLVAETTTGEVHAIRASSTRRTTGCRRPTSTASSPPRARGLSPAASSSARQTSRAFALPAAEPWHRRDPVRRDTRRGHVRPSLRSCSARDARTAASCGDRCARAPAVRPRVKTGSSGSSHSMVGRGQKLIRHTRLGAAGGSSRSSCSRRLGV